MYLYCYVYVFYVCLCIIIVMYVLYSVSLCCFVYNNNNIYLLQLGCNPVAVVILRVYKTLNCLLLNLSLEGYMRSM